MKYKVIGYSEGWIVANKNNIRCVGGFTDENGDNIDPQIGDIVSDKSFEGWDEFWHYTRSEWEQLNKKFDKLKNINLGKYK